ncbi:MAG TPA: efflux RND transporter periplasmic adaptor subunit [Bryobacteraceae bacterium]|nr:efflux RND transporter periplasmic adaptor subunit [Bryobacteraceae bacterium]
MLSNKSIPVLLACLALTACHDAPRKVEASFSQSTAVKVIPAAPVEWPTVLEAVGTVRARTSIVIASKAMGYVREVDFRLGDQVTAGQLLVVLDLRDLDAAYRQAQAARQEATLAATEANNAVASAQANLDLAKITFQRMADLFQKKSISNQEYDEANAKLKVAQATYDMVVSRRTQAEARIRQTEEAVAAAAVLRGYSEIRAPFAGTVTEKQVEAGTLAAPGAPLLTIEQAGALRLEVAVEEGFLATVRPGQAVTVKLDSLDRSIDARVSEVVPSVDPASRAFTVKIDLPPVPHLRSGVYGRAQFSRGTRQIVAVPASAVAEQGQVQTVMVVEDAFARTRIVTTGQKQNDLVEILSGLNPGEHVALSRPAGLVDGARVEARQ